MDIDVTTRALAKLMNMSPWRASDAVKLKSSGNFCKEVLSMLNLAGTTRR
jgi:hypothetical protein